jgi:5,10-methylenetetrahydromethanopterin reductase
MQKMTWGNRMLEMWRAGGSNTGASPEAARPVEAEGWDGQMFMCSQCLSADPYVQMGVWATATSRLKLSTGVTNPFTRNIAVTAAAAATVQAVSNGRAVLGIGRGDSALAYLGHAPVSLKSFETALKHLQVLLSGGEIPFAEFGSSGDAPDLHEISLGGRPEGVRLRWLSPDLPKVELDVAATGPKVIAMGARIAERVTFSLGAEPERLAWGLEVARQARAEAGLPEDGVSYGAQLVVVCHPDEEKAMQVAMHMAPPLARFQVIQGKQVGPTDAAMSENLDAIKSGYDMNKHGVHDAKDRIIGGGLSPDFVRKFAIVGTPDHCTARLLELRQLGPWLLSRKLGRRGEAVREGSTSGSQAGLGLGPGLARFLRRGRGGLGLRLVSLGRLEDGFALGLLANGVLVDHVGRSAGCRPADQLHLQSPCSCAGPASPGRLGSAALPLHARQCKPQAANFVRYPAESRPQRRMVDRRASGYMIYGVSLIGRRDSAGPESNWRRKWQRHLRQPTSNATISPTTRCCSIPTIISRICVSTGPSTR